MPTGVGGVFDPEIQSPTLECETLCDPESHITLFLCMFVEVTVDGYNARDIGMCAVMDHGSFLQNFIIFAFYAQVSLHERSIKEKYE